MFLYTDGVNEALDTAQRLYGKPRLVKNMLNKGTGHGAEELIRYAAEDIREFAAGAEQADYITMLMIIYRGNRMIRLEIPAQRGRLDEVLEFINTMLERENCPVNISGKSIWRLKKVFVNARCTRMAGRTQGHACL